MMLGGELAFFWLVASCAVLKGGWQIAIHTNGIKIIAVLVAVMFIFPI